jgi:hypothetical protein
MRLYVTSILLFVGTVLSAQVFLQLEKYENPVAEKYFIGDYIIYKHADYDDGWRKERIERINLEAQSIMTSGSFVEISEIGQVRTYNGGVKAAAMSLKVFGAAWLVYGGIAYVGDNFDFGPDTAAIGLGSLAAGWLLQKLFYKNTYKIGNRHRVRLMDTRWE